MGAFLRRGVAAFFLVLLASCGEGDDRAPTRGVGAERFKLEALDIRFDIRTTAIRISAWLSGGEPQERELFYFVGKLAPDAELRTPISETKLRISCADLQCLTFEFPLVGKRLSLAEPIRVSRYYLTQLKAEGYEGLPPAENGPLSAPAIWGDLLKGGIDAGKSSLLVAKHGGKQYLSAFLLGATANARTEWVSLSASPKPGRLSADCSYRNAEKTGNVFVLATLPGALETIASGRIRVTVPPTKFEATLSLHP